MEELCKDWLFPLKPIVLGRSLGPEDPHSSGSTSGLG